LSNHQKFIGVYLQNKQLFVEALSGIILSGDVIVPLYIEGGVIRINKVIDECQIETLITENRYKNTLVNNFPSIKNIVVLDDNSGVIQKHDEKRVISIECDKRVVGCNVRTVKDSIQNYIYAIYTSGSTGSPKGIKVTNYNVMHLFDWLKINFNLTSSTRSYHHLSTSFDFGLKEMFNILMNGGSLVLSTTHDIYQPNKMVEQINKHKVNLLYTTPTIFREIIDGHGKMPTIDLICLGGEVLDYSLLYELKYQLKDDVIIYNGYGPSETSINALMHKVELTEFKKNSDFSSVPIGVSSGNSSVLLLDQNLNLLPAGIIGEIYIGGPGVTEGYINDELLTRKKFKKINIGNKQSTYYKTGDLAVYNERNEIVFINRVDDEVKIRGFRVNLTEIESTLRQLPYIEYSKVLYDEKLIAYIKPTKNINIHIKNSIYEFLKKQLPNYMIPNELIELQKVPVTKNGKLDKLKLIELVSESKVGHESMNITNNDLDKRILMCWERVLGKNIVNSIDDNFFDIGGHSLNAYKLLNLLEEEFKLKFNITEIFEYSTIKSFRKKMEEMKTEEIKNEDVLIQNLVERNRRIESIRKRRDRL